MDDYECLVACLEADLPHPVIPSLVALNDGVGTVQDAREAWVASDYWPSGFSKTVEQVLGICVDECRDCYVWYSADDGRLAPHGFLCDECVWDYFTCYECGNLTHGDDSTYVHGNLWCGGCVDRYCHVCDACDEYVVTDEHDEHDEHDENCDCEAPNRRFQFPANGAGTVAQDTRLDVTLPAGTIDEAGISAIRRILHDALRDTPHHYAIVRKALDAIGDDWAGRKGNYTRRLSRELYSVHKVKIPDGVLSEIGNIARAHSSSTAAWSCEFTRNLNLPAEDFYHDESCWWQSYSASRCALKNWGGLGLRTFDGCGEVTGRAWVQPLDKVLQPTHDTLGARAYVVYNCYGDLDGAKAARIVAHLTSRTYRKVAYAADPQYVNSGTGWLVADEATCSSTDNVSTYTEDHHDTIDAHTVSEDATA